MLSAGEAALRAGRGGARLFIWSRARAPSRRQYASRLERCGRRHRHSHCHRRREVSPSPPPAAVTLTPLASAPPPSPSPAGKRPGAALGAGWKVGDPYPGFPVPGVLLAGDVWGPRLRNTSLAGVPVPGWRSWQPGPLRASVSASVQWGGPSAPRPGNPAPHRPALPSCAASGAGLPRPWGTGPESGAASPGPRRYTRAATKKRKMASSTGPRRPRGAPEPRTFEGPETGRTQDAGKSGTGTARRAGAAPSSYPRPVQVRPAGKAPGSPV